MTENISDKRTCPKCGEPKPVREFRVFDDSVLHCRACRHRSVMKQRERDRRETVKLKARLRARNEGTGAYKGKQVLEAKLRFIKTHYLKATAVTRRRIKEMSRVEDPSGKTQKALEVRETVLERYEQAYQQQKTMTFAGVAVPNIHDMV